MKENIERIRNRLLKVLRILKSPPPGTALAYGILSLIFVAVVLMTPLHRTPVAYISYALSAVGLCELVVVIVPGVRHIRQKLDEIPAVYRYNTDPLLKARVSLYSSTLFNVLFSLLKFVMGIWLQSTWLSAIGIFYLTLILIRFPLVWEDIRALRAKQPLSLAQQWIDYRRTGWLMPRRPGRWISALP